MTVFRDITRQTVIYGAGAGLNGAVGFILIPIVTRYLLPNEYGTYALLEIALQFLVTVYGLGFNVSLLKGYSEADDSVSKINLINNVLIFLATTSFIFSGVIIALAGPISNGLFAGVPEHLIVYIGLIVFFESIWALFLAIYRAEQKAVRYLAASLLQVGLGLMATVVFVVGMNEKAEGILRGRLVGDVLVCGVLLWGHRNRFTFDHSWPRIRRLLAYGLPYLPAGLAIIWINLSGRYFLNLFSSLGEVGVYAIAQKLSGFVNLLLIQPFGTAWLPIMFELGKRNNAPLIYARVATYYLFCAAFSFLILTLFLPEIFLIFTTKGYQSGTKVYPILVLALLVYGLFYVLSIGIFLKSRNWVMPYIYGAGIIVNLLSNTILVRLYGAWGAALSMLLTFIVVSGCQGLIAQRYYPIPFEFNRLGKILLVGVILFMTGRFFMSEGVPHLVLRTGLIALFPVALYGLGFFTDEERNRAFYFSHHLRLRGALIAKAILKRREQ
ncbi:MAG TPA: oligosaccharide flippase family protein [Nitrospiria bacterium]|nr:oligosaccharide flippase family protein [Nitrospiria bacterium]HUK56443.1 oligosaccharide flippase family protein [Nitrospiria bacterium]